MKKRKRRVLSMVLVTGMAMNLFANGTVFGADDNVWNSSASIKTTRVSVASDGTQLAGASLCAVSPNSRYIVFNSPQAIMPGDTNNSYDVFVKDTQTGAITMVSVASDGTIGNGHSHGGSISADGRYVVFQSESYNLSAEDPETCSDIYLHDMQTGTTKLISVSSSGQKSDDLSNMATISENGRYVVYHSLGTNLVSGDTNGKQDIFLYDIQTGETKRVSIASDGTQGDGNSTGGASISSDGQYITFSSEATNLVTGDTNASGDVFVHDMQTGETTRESVASDGAQANGDSSGYKTPSISADGRYVEFHALATNLVSDDTNKTSDVFVHDRQTGETTRVSVASDGTQANADSYSEVGVPIGLNRYIVFYSYATNLVAGDTNASYDTFVHDMQTGETKRVSVASDGTQANSSSYVGFISADGQRIVYGSAASNLVLGDTNDAGDIFVATAVDLTTNANLSNLTLSSGTLSPTFATDTTEYTASVGSDVNSLIVTPTLEYSGATVKVNGTSVTSGSASQDISLSSGTNTIPVVVTAADGTTTKTYTITVTKEVSASYAITMKVTSIAAYNEAVVTIKNSAGSVLYTLNPGADGVLTTPLLPVGSYTVECSKAGFLKTTIRNIPIVDKAVTLSNVVLTPGDLDGDGKINTTDTTIINSCYNVTSSSGK